MKPASLSMNNNSGFEYLHCWGQRRPCSSEWLAGLRPVGDQLAQGRPASSSQPAGRRAPASQLRPAGELQSSSGRQARAGLSRPEERSGGFLEIFHENKNKNVFLKNLGRISIIFEDFTCQILEKSRKISRNVFLFLFLEHFPITHFCETRLGSRIS